MADDIVTQLRFIVPIHEGRRGHDCIAAAADEIERLRAEVERLMKIVEFSCGTAGDCFWKNYAATPQEDDRAE